MKNGNIRKKIIKVISIILVIICLIIGYIFISYKLNPIEVVEISILQESFEIESNSIIVVLANDNIEVDIEEVVEETEENIEEEKVSPPKSNSNSSTGRTQNSNSGGSGATVSQATYTPKIQIPRTGVKLTVYSEMTVSNMERGVSILSTDSGLNQPGNTVISGHNYVNGRLFSNNHKIQVGDLIHITDSTGQKITYSVYNKYLTTPHDAEYMVRDTAGAREISLTTCTNDSSQRLIILAKEV